MDSHGRHVCADGNRRTHMDTHGQPRTSCVCWRTPTDVLCVLNRQPTWAKKSPEQSTGRVSVPSPVRVCPCVSVSTHRTSVAVHQYTYQHAGPFRGLTSVFVRQHTQDVRCCPCVSVCVRQHTQDVRGCPCMSVCVRVCPSAHTGRPWLSISTHISTLVLGLSMLTLPVDCSGDFGPRGLSVQYTQDVRGCPPAHTGRPWLSVHVRVCPSVSVSTHRISVAVRVCPSAHTGRLWLSISTQISTLVLGLSTLALPVTCLGDFGPRGLSVQYTQDVRGCPPAHPGRLWLSVAVRQHTLDIRGCQCVSVCVRQHTQDVCGCLSAHTGRLWLSVCVRQLTQDVCGCPSVHISARWSLDSARWPFPWTIWVILAHVGCLFSTNRTSVGVASTHRTSVAVPQHTQDVRGCPCMSVCVRLCPSAHTGRPWLSISTHISTLVLGLSTLALVVDSSDDFGPRGLSVQYTQDVRGCPSAHTGRLCVSVSTHRTFVAVCVCLCVSVSTHISTLVFGLSTLTLPVDCSGDFGPRGLSVQYTQDVCGCPPAHTRLSWLSVHVHVCPSVSVSIHRTSMAVHLYTYQHYTQDVCGCPPAHIGCLWLSVCVRVCPYVSVSTQRTYVAVHQYTYQHVGPWTQHTGPSRGLTHMTSMGVRQHTQDVHGCLCVSVSSHRTSVAVHHTHRTSVGVRQHTHDVRGCLWLSVSTHRTSMAVRVSPCVSVSTHMTSVGVRQHTQDVCGCSCVSVSSHRTTHRTSVGVRQHTQDVCGCLWLSVSTHKISVAVRVCPCVSVSTHRTSVGVRQHTQDVCGCPCVSVSSHRTSVAVHQNTNQHVGPWTQHAGPSHELFGTSVAVCVCPSAHTGHPWLSVCVRVCLSAHTGRLWVSVSTHMTSVAVRVCPSAHTGRLWLSISTHISTLVLGLSTLALPMDYLGDFSPRGLSVQYKQDVRGCRQHTQDVCGCPSAHTGRSWLSVYVYVCPCVSVSTHRTSVAVHHTHRTSVGVRQQTQDVRVCPSAHTGRPWLSVCVRVCPSAHTGHPWLSISTHISTLVLGLSTLTLPVDCSGDFGPRGLSVQYTQDVRGCPPAHIGRPWLSLRVCVCPSVSVSTHRTSMAVHLIHRTSVGVRQHTQDICGCLWLSVTTHMTSVAVRVCPSAHTGRLWLSISTHISTLVLGLSTLALPVDCSGDFGPRGLSVQYTPDVRGCLSAHIAHRTSVGVRQHTQDGRGCPWVSFSTHRTSMAVHQYTYQHIGLWTQHADPSRGLFGHRTSVAVRVCPCVSVSTHRTFVAVHQYTYQNVGPWTQHADPSCGLFGQYWPT
ncbi:hypothetical protein YC2023_108624 [Brassica napus]